MGKAIQDLLNEHDAILQVLGIVDHVLTNPVEPDQEKRFAGELLHFLTIFVDKCHHGKEEQMLFPRLEELGVPNQGGPIGMMLIEHVQGRELIGQMKLAIEREDLAAFKQALRAYSDLLRGHIAKENNVLFPLADRLLAEDEQLALFERFEQHEETVVGQGVHEALHADIHIWELQFGL
jgi:hemerythrin-like domain-containing protein